MNDIRLTKAERCYYVNLRSDPHISINFKMIQYYAVHQNKSFNEMVARVINHETIHHVLAKMTNFQTKGACIKLDKIACKYSDYWLW